LQRAALLATTINAYRDPKKSRPVSVNDMAVLDHREPVKKQTPEQMAAALRGIAAQFKDKAEKKKDGSQG
jgi:hypothetical protein